MMSLLLFLHRVKKAATDDDRDDGCVREKSSCVPSKVDEAHHLVCLVEERGKKKGEHGWPPIRPCIHGSHAQRNHNKNASFYGYSNKR